MKFRVPLGIRIVGQWHSRQILFQIVEFRLQSSNFAFEPLSATFVFHLSERNFRDF